MTALEVLAIMETVYFLALFLMIEVELTRVNKLIKYLIDQQKQKDGEQE